MPIKEVQLPHLGRTVKLGRRRGVAPTPRLHLRDYLKFSLPDAPPVADYTSKATSSLENLFLNDQYGDCVIAGGYHIVGVETGNCDTVFVPSDDQILADYEAIGRFDPNNPLATDNGCVIDDAINYWTHCGFQNGTKLMGSFVVDPTNKREVQQTLFLFENAILGMQLPNPWINPFPSTANITWDVAGPPDPNNGHCVAGVAYDANALKIVTWGLIVDLTYEALATYAARQAGGEIHVLVTPDQVKRGQARAPNGVAWTDLVNDFGWLNQRQVA